MFNPLLRSNFVFKDLTGPVSRNSPKPFALVKFVLLLPHPFKSPTLQFIFFHAILLYAFVH